MTGEELSDQVDRALLAAIVSDKDETPFPYDDCQRLVRRGWIYIQDNGGDNNIVITDAGLRAHRAK